MAGRLVATIDPRLDVVEAELERMPRDDRIVLQVKDHVPTVVPSRPVEAASGVR
jgi:hypothetical protein